MYSMIKFITTLALLISINLPCLAQELLGYYYSGFVIQGPKAYKVTTTYNDSDYSSTRKIEQYDFPSLVFQNSLSLNDENGYVSSIQVEDNGLLVSLRTWTSDYQDNDDGSVTVTDTYLDTYRSYDLTLTLIGEQASEDTYSYTYYPYYFDGGSACLENDSTRKVAARVHAKKKGGKKGGTSSCSKVRTVSHKVIK